MKVSTGLKDAWGQEIFLGDLVINFKNGSWDARPSVVTRVGTKDNIQTNGSGYASPDLYILVTDQYVKHHGVEAHEKLMQRYPFNEERVKDKSPTLKYIVVKTNRYSKVDQRYYVLSVCGNNQVERNGWAKERNKLLCIDGVYSHLIMRPSRYDFVFAYSADPITKKALVELGSEVGIDFLQYVDSEITNQSHVAILDAYLEV
jgi:hypothetical protein